jgi:hypothetical protein
MPKQPAQSSVIFDVLALIGWFALGLQLYILIDNTPDNEARTSRGRVSYFLYDSQ